MNPVRSWRIDNEGGEGDMLEQEEVMEEEEEASSLSGSSLFRRP